MEFELTPEQVQLRNMVREFAQAEIAPHVLEWDEPDFPLDVIKKAGQLGLLGAIFPEESGRRRIWAISITPSLLRNCARGPERCAHHCRAQFTLYQSHFSCR